MIKNAIIFTGGIVVGLLIAKEYARLKTESAINSALPSFLRGTFVEEGLDRLIVPSVSG